MDRLLRPCRRRRKIHPFEPACLRIPDEPLHRLAPRSRRHGRFGHRLDHEVIRGGEAVDRECAIEPAGEQRDRRAGARRHRVVGQRFCRQQTPVRELFEQTDGPTPGCGRHVVHDRRREQILGNVGPVVGVGDTGGQRLDDTGPVLDIIRPKPGHEWLPGLSAHAADELPRQSACPAVAGVFSLQQVNKHR